MRAIRTHNTHTHAPTHTLELGALWLALAGGTDLTHLQSGVHSLLLSVLRRVHVSLLRVGRVLLRLLRVAVAGRGRLCGVW